MAPRGPAASVAIVNVWPFQAGLGFPLGAAAKALSAVDFSSSSMLAAAWLTPAVPTRRKPASTAWVEQRFAIAIPPGCLHGCHLLRTRSTATRGESVGTARRALRLDRRAR